MEYQHPHDLASAKKIQQRLKKKVITSSSGFFSSCMEFYLAGIDVSFKKETSQVQSAVVIMHYPSLAIKEIATHRQEVTFPYIPGFLAFREVPVIMSAWEKIKTDAQLLIIDGQGRTHPRHFGIACHLGVLLDKPSIGCGKTHLYGDYTPPAPQKGSFSYISDPKGGEILGAVLRTRSQVSCIYISPGHRMDTDESVSLILSLTGKYRLPEPIRYAHKYAGIWD